ncbi:TolC family protein [Chryseosolibacter indicus]|uniref:TolC family protein n=1 Tax=Chryseosolibacter indicus TaxID=2782351 RepID=A0ABS5VQY9_9BACT|nr:TolC family protein [Chryseosolibacter indicus]MBT1702436.1 TolC family protein [Chryseosolibacter indicus]
MKHIIGVFVLTSLINLVNAQVNPELSKLIKQSFEYFPRLKELEKTTEMGEVRIGIARSNYLPSFNGNASYNYVDPVGEASFPVGPTETRTIQFQPHNNYNANISLNQVLYDFGRTQAQIDKAKSDLQNNQYNREAARLQLASQVATIYFGIIYLKEAIQLQDTIISFYIVNRNIVEGKIKQGDALKIDLNNVDNNIQQEESRKIELQRLYNRQLALLKYTANSNEVPSTSDFHLRRIANDESSLQANPEVLAATQRVLSAEADLKYAQHQQLPSLNVVANAGFRNGYQPDIEEIRFNYLAGLNLTVPIFQGRRLKQNILLSRKNVELNEISKSNLSLTLQKDLESVQADIQAYGKQIESYDSQIATANEALRLNRVRYERGVAIYLDLLNASTNLQRALTSKLQYEYQQCLGYIEEARLLGNKFWEE